MQNTIEIEKIAPMLDVHPIHLKMFLLRNSSISSEADFIHAFKNYKQENPKPFVKWVGGKRQLLKQFRDLNLYPPEGFNPKTATYFEPFVGGGAMFFDLLPKKAVLSDMNLELVTTYNIIKSNVSGLIKKLKEHQSNNSKNYFIEIRAQILQGMSDTDVAARFIYLNRTCFNGLYRVNKSGQFNVPFGENKNPLICDEVNLRKISSSLVNTKIIHQDYKKILEKAKKGDFIYFDPPYYPVNLTSNFTNYTKEGFLENEQEELRNTFVELSKRGCFVMLSNSDTPFINTLYSNLGKKIKIHKVLATRAINSKSEGRGRINEVVVINY
ncbi:MAG: adenine methylase protein [Candidatus Falkowbacteria bacterium GW2011_GWF2_39_8]|uniref:Site-specific DNA-methyltransferase (adenine-specific) n=1 Tax=Candidatus Falkowbacteria bacterium GW2011_GWF2_39_8 TaxID=1618642 RepID=A0A0G0Q4U1_9BACT|nr:MAG: adenine methylase protein [Candidatus Falkowbacteria bacterium GW2011_GWF2_39_8]